MYKVKPSLLHSETKYWHCIYTEGSETNDLCLLEIHVRVASMIVGMHWTSSEQPKIIAT